MQGTETNHHRPFPLPLHPDQPVAIPARGRLAREAEALRGRAGLRVLRRFRVLRRCTGIEGRGVQGDLGVSVDVCVLVEESGLVEVDSGTLLDELVGAELVGFGVSLDDLELELGLWAVDSGFLLETLVV